jgi:3-isopropylmalate dehydrogenase
MKSLLAGDGIGPEILREAVRVLDVLRARASRSRPRKRLVGGAAYDAHGDPLPEATLKLAQAADAVLFGAVGGPKYDTLPRDKRPERASSTCARSATSSRTCARRRCSRSWRTPRR